jgi:hypothetical protein
MTDPHAQIPAIFDYNERKQRTSLGNGSMMLQERTPAVTEDFLEDRRETAQKGE